jgi:hypothetical protein
MIQGILTGLIFLAAMVYLGRQVFHSFQARSCASGCGKCTAVDFGKIEREVRSRENLLA